MILVRISRKSKFLLNIKDQVEELRLELIEKVAELDEELTMKYLEGEEITVDRNQSSSA